jgi:hypothetical protein
LIVGGTVVGSGGMIKPETRFYAIGTIFCCILEITTGAFINEFDLRGDSLLDPSQKPAAFMCMPHTTISASIGRYVCPIVRFTR